MPILGLTGGIATGKSTSSALLASAISAELFDCDATVHALLKTDSGVHARIREAFGDEVFDASGVPDRIKLRELVFGEDLHRVKLEGILHPEIRGKWRERIAHHRKTDAWLIVDVPLLFEIAAQDDFDRVIVVACARETQLTRLRDFRQLPPVISQRILASQWDLQMKIHFGQHVIWNDSTQAALEAQIKHLAAWLKEEYGSSN